jgi:antitoxin component YwqK of YwqJK toxin-antitoxin module
MDIDEDNLWIGVIDDDGNCQGMQIKFYDNEHNIIHSILYFKDDKPIGEWIEYDREKNIIKKINWNIPKNENLE